MTLVNVILPVPINSTFNYNSNGLDVDVGNLVEVNFSGRNTVGLVVGIENDKNIGESKYKIKNVLSVLPYKKISLKDINFLKNVSDFNVIPIGLVFNMMCTDCIFGNNVEKTVKKYRIKFNKRRTS